MVRRGIAVLVSSLLVVNSATAGPLVFKMRQPLPDVPKHRGFFACTSELNRAVGEYLVYIEPRHAADHLEHSRYYRLSALLKSPQQYVRIHAGCTTSRNGREVIGMVIGAAPLPWTEVR